MIGCGREREGVTLNFEREKEEPRPPSRLSLSLSRSVPGEEPVKKPGGRHQ